MITEPDMPRFHQITLIVATTPSLGIGYQGSLPWKALSKDMAFFRRVTTRVPDQSEQSTMHNAVIMGRKTWESIPQKFRPLSKRVNVVVSRNLAGIEETECVSRIGVTPLSASSIAEGLRMLQMREKHVGRVFCIGGAQIYNEVMKMDCAERILRTKVMEEYECDVFFPGEKVFAGKDGWTQCSSAELDAWVGEEDVGAAKKEGEVNFAIEMWEKNR